MGLNCFTVSSGLCFVVYGCEFVGCWLCKLVICLCDLCFGLGLVCGYLADFGSSGWRVVVVLVY